MNKVQLTGNVGTDLTMRTFENGKVASFSLATNERYTDKTNKEVTKTTWHNIVVFGKVADICEGLVAKGKLINVEGKLNHRQYQNKDGQTVNVTEIQAFKVAEILAKAEA